MLVVPKVRWKSASHIIRYRWSTVWSRKAGFARPDRRFAAPAVMGLSFEEMLDIVSLLALGDFFKSMTTHADHRIWQDVYQPASEAGDIYVKLTVIDDLLIVSFKEL